RSQGPILGGASVRRSGGAANVGPGPPRIAQEPGFGGAHSPRPRVWTRSALAAQSRVVVHDEPCSAASLEGRGDAHLDALDARGSEEPLHDRRGSDLAAD